jgi:D-alanyl-D-alanine carboxypeptidase
MSGGPPGAIAVIQRRNRRQVHTAGVANVNTGHPLRRLQHMRVASVSKAFSGAAALALVGEGVLSLDDAIGTRLPDLPEAWHRVTLRQLLAHTSGLPDFTASGRFREAFVASPDAAPRPRDLLAFVADEPLNFPPGSEYRYSNSDNIVVALMIEAAIGARYEHALSTKVLKPRGLRRTGMAEGILLPRPFIRGYASEESGPPENVSQVAAWGGWAWASGGITSTPGNLNRFVRAYVGGGLFGERVRGQQFRTVRGARSEPPGPGRNDGGLALFRYRTRCGTVFGHTGSILGYTQLIAAKRNGRRSLTLTITSQVSEEILPALRSTQVRAVCAALARR